MRKRLIELFVILLMFCGTSCDSGKIYEEYHEFDNMSWNRFNFLEFNVPVKETGLQYNALLSIRHLPEFPHKEVKINMTYYLPSGEMRTHDYMLRFYDQDGNKLSKCMGDYCDILIPVRENIFVPEAGVLKFEIENKMTKLETPGILEIGLVLNKSE